MVAVLAAVFVQYGSPPTLAERAWDSFNAPPEGAQTDLNDRLFSLSANGRKDHWRVAWEAFQSEPVLGTGAGSYERMWLEERAFFFDAQDAHSLYLETLAELGVVGLVLLLAALGVPLIAAVRARKHGLVPAAFGAYCAWLLHAGIDWDWELPAVTLAGFFCAAAMLAAARSGSRAAYLSGRARATLLVGTLVVSGFVLVGLIGNRAIDASNDAVAVAQWDRAETEARKATRWAPWSAEPWALIGEAQLGRNEFANARASFRKAIDRDPGQGPR